MHDYHFTPCVTTVALQFRVSTVAGVQSFMGLNSHQCQKLSENQEPSSRSLEQFLYMKPMDLKKESKDVKHASTI